MASIHSILPLVDPDTWRWKKEEEENRRIRAGRSHDIIRDPGNLGFIYYGQVGVTGEDGEKTEIDMSVDMFEYKVTIEDTFKAGLTGTGNTAPTVTRYDTDQDIYALTITPNPPIAYLDTARLSIDAPQRSDIILNASSIKLEITDRVEFARSYRKVTAGNVDEKIDDLLEKIDMLNNNIRSMVDVLNDRTRSPLGK